MSYLRYENHPLTHKRHVPLRAGRLFVMVIFVFSSVVASIYCDKVIRVFVVYQVVLGWIGGGNILLRSTKTI